MYNLLNVAIRSLSPVEPDSFFSARDKLNLHVFGNGGSSFFEITSSINAKDYLQAICFAVSHPDFKELTFYDGKSLNHISSKDMRDPHEFNRKLDGLAKVAESGNHDLQVKLLYGHVTYIRFRRINDIVTAIAIHNESSHVHSYAVLPI